MKQQDPDQLQVQGWCRGGPSHSRAAAVGEMGVRVCYGSSPQDACLPFPRDSCCCHAPRWEGASANAVPGRAG